jgi:O-antigen/teichoic acid export membrane protein
MAGFGLAALAVLLLPASFIGLPGVGEDLFPTLLFAAGVGVTAVSLVLDQGLLSLLGGGPQLGRNSILAIAKLVLLIVLALTLSGAGPMVIYSSWLLGNVLSVVVLAVWLSVRHQVRPHRLRPSVGLLRGMRRDAMEHHALNLGLQLPYFAMPIVASAVLGSAEAGYLYAAWAVAAFVFVLPVALATALFASGARGTEGFDRQLRFSLRISFLACLAANLVLLPLGGFVLDIFGDDYRTAARLALIIVCAGGFGLIIKDHHVSVARVLGGVGREAAFMWGSAGAEIGLAAVGAHLGGLTGLAIGWLCAAILEGLLFLPLVLRARSGRLAKASARVVPVPNAGP